MEINKYKPKIDSRYSRYFSKDSVNRLQNRSSLSVCIKECYDVRNFEYAMIAGIVKIRLILNNVSFVS